jgi:integrase
MARGVYENPEGSGVWWIHYYAEGKRHREKVGRKADAQKLYTQRKADSQRGIKLPEIGRKLKKVFILDISADAMAYAKDHLKSWKSYEWKARKVVEDWGTIPVDEVKPLAIDAWIAKHTSTPASGNRYKAYWSLMYRLALQNGKASMNPASMVRHRKEANQRIRYLSRDEYATLLSVIRETYPQFANSFTVSVYTGMRWGEQFSLTWSQVDLEQQNIFLDKTKNGDARDVPLNSVAFTAVQEQYGEVPHAPTDLVFPGHGYYCRFWFLPCMDAAKIEGYTWHSNRHTFCSWLAMAGVSIKEIQVLAGHKTIQMSARYSHLSPQVAKTATERIV